ncbi:hypothetical protein [Acinetobacter baumannii]|uniref:hypothetical protein n=2 Tax=Acinetobacter baumannii TaxID=470 RepID=UPI00290560FE|nr:hypothetical protein [Acinetobacter baumannii]MDW5389670.1 hypothetical protein [Acinetobacter baumannii]MDW5448362.1 hypothetical protein [Acinetobacter baumannii]
MTGMVGAGMGGCFIQYFAIMIKGNIVEDTCSTKSNEIECNAVNNLNIKLDSEYLNKDSLYKLAQHTEKMDTSIESLGSNRKIILINYH